MKLVIVVQARTGSTRLPRKILKPILGKSLLYRQMERILAAEEQFDCVVATTTDSEDDAVVDICERNDFEFFRGHPTDLLDRHYRAAKEFNADTVAKIPSDCPLIDPRIIDKVIRFYRENQDKYDFVSNLHPAGYPDGNDVEIMPMEVLKKAWLEAKKEHEREHTTPYIWDNTDKFRIGNVEWETGLDYSMSHRFTIDYQEDYEFIKRIYEELYPKNPIFSLEDILNLLKEKPEIYKINEKYAGVNWYRNNLDELKTVDISKTRVL